MEKSSQHPSKPHGCIVWVLCVETQQKDQTKFRVNIYPDKIKGKLQRDDGTWDYMFGPDNTMKVFSGECVFDDPEEARNAMIARIVVTPLDKPKAF